MTPASSAESSPKTAESGEHFPIDARVVVNATGIFTDETRRLANPGAPPMIQPSQGIHLVLDREFLRGNTAIMVPHTSDGRVLFAIPWHQHAVVGTTDTPIDAPSYEPLPFEHEIAFILETAAEYLSRPPRREDVLSVYVGIRPLVKAAGSDTGRTSRFSRDHTIHIDDSGLLTIAGGKWTTYRRMAQDAVDHAITLGRLEDKPCVTQDLRLHGYAENTPRRTTRSRSMVRMRRRFAGSPPNPRNWRAHSIPSFRPSPPRWYGRCAKRWPVPSKTSWPGEPAPSSFVRGQRCAWRPPSPRSWLANSAATPPGSPSSSKNSASSPPSTPSSKRLTPSCRTSGPARSHRRRHHSHKRIGATIIEKPPAVERNQPLAKRGPRHILAALLPRHLRLQHRIIRARQQLRRMVRIEQSLANSVRARRQRRIAPGRRILPVIENDDAAARQHRRRPGLRKRAVESSRARPQHLQRLALLVLHRRPVDQVRRRRQMDRPLAPVHPVLAVDPSCDQPPFVRRGHNPRRLVFQMRVLSALRIQKRRSMLRPVHQIRRRRDPHRIRLPIPLRVGQDIFAIFALNNPRILHASRPLAALLVVFSRIKHRLARRVK